eukprot:3834575-Amphidinium_carterae.1
MRKACKQLLNSQRDHQSLRVCSLSFPPGLLHPRQARTRWLLRLHLHLHCPSLDNAFAVQEVVASSRFGKAIGASRFAELSRVVEGTACGCVFDTWV